MLMVRELGLGGSERQLTETALRLDRSRFEPHVGCFRPCGFRGEELARAGVPVERFPVHSFLHPSSLAAAVQVGRYVERHRIQLVHSFDTPMNLFGVAAARAFQTRVVLSSQRANRELSSGLERHLLRLTDSMVDAVVVNCDAVRRHLLQDESVPAGRIRVCHNGIDTGRFHPGERSRPAELREAGVVIGVVCALRPEKGLHLLLEAFRKIRGGAVKPKLVVVGDGPSGPELKSLCSQLGLNEDCLFVAATKHVADWLHAIDIFVLPSLSEALSNSLMEAMACGCAAIASRVGGNGELVRHGQTGLLFERADSGDLARWLAELIGNPESRHNLAKEGARFIRENFSLDRAAARMGEIYEEALLRAR